MENSPKLNRKIRLTRRVLQESLMELMKTKAIADISIKELCAMADINRSTFYAHYKDQYDLLRQIEEDTSAYISESLNKYDFKGSKSEAIKMVEEILLNVRKNIGSIQTLLEHGDIDFQKKMFGFIHEKNIMKTSRSEKKIDKKTQECYFAFAISGSLGLVQHWLKTDMNIPEHELAEMLIELAYPHT